MIVTLKGDTKDTQSSRAGIYVLGPDLVNGKPHWLQEPGSNSIWYDDKKGRWHIAPLLSSGWIYSPDDVATPQFARTWKYYNKKWIASDDILVETFVEPNLNLRSGAEQVPG